MKEVIRFLLSKFPTGDYRNLFKEEDLSDDGGSKGEVNEGRRACGAAR